MQPWSDHAGTIYVDRLDRKLVVEETLIPPFQVHKIAVLSVGATGMSL